MDSKEFATSLKSAKIERRKSGLRSGPEYNGNEGAPLVWFDQVFERNLPTTGDITCETPLRVGATQNGLDVILVASHANAGPVFAQEGATVTLKTLQSDSEFGGFEYIGPTICVTAPLDGITADPDQLFARFAIGNFSKPWVKIELTFGGTKKDGTPATITGGTIDCALAYQPR